MIETINPHEAHVGGEIIITMSPVLVSDPNVLDDIWKFLKVKIGGVGAEYDISPNRDFIFCKVPAGLKAGQQCEIEVDDSGHQI